MATNPEQLAGNAKPNFDPTKAGPKQAIQDIWDPGGLFSSGPSGGNHGNSGLVDETAYATRDFKEIYGRDPTPVELAQIVPSYVGSDTNLPNQAAGKAFIASMFQQEQNTPDKLYAKQQAEYLANAPKHYDDVNSLFQSNLGRTATQQELDHFGSLLASGTVDPYQLQSFIQQQPEYQTTQNKKFQNDLSGQLSGYDQTYFQNNILPSIQEAYAKQGRSFDSSAFQNAATNSAQQQNTSRQQYLASLIASQYGGIEQNAYNNYANQVAQQQNLTNSGIQAQYAGIQNNISRSNQFSDYQNQSQAYNNYLAKYGKRSGAQGALSGATAGAGIGTSILPGWGTAIGAGVGAIGGYLGQGGNY